MSTKEDAIEILNCMTEEQLDAFVHFFHSIMEIPNEETRKAMEDVKHDRNIVGTFDSVEEMMEELLKDE